MLKYSLKFVLAAIALLPACASRPGVRAGRVLARHANSTGLSVTENVPPPSWVDRLPAEPGYHFFVGEAVGNTDKEQALAKAWMGALVRIGMTQFPELASLTSESVERLKSSSYERRFFLRLENVNWAGVQEATSYGSPYIDLDPESGQYTVYRLLKWADEDLGTARKRIQEAKVFRIPSPPEFARRDEERLVEAVQAIQSLNERIDRRNAYLVSVLEKVKCGVTIADLMAILGPPDRFNPNNRHLIEKEYFWGTYKIERQGADPTVTAIVDDGGQGKRHAVCRSGREE